MSVYDYKATNIRGKEVSLSDYRGYVMLIVNTASKCGFTPQFEGLEELYKEYEDRKFVVLGFPCNQFGSQEPGDENDINDFCQLNYGVSFPMFSKIDVNGDETHPLFAYLKENATGLLGSKAVKWNFTKFLVDRNGEVVERFASATTPANIKNDIEKLL
ncbi:glutathione peroxidase [Sutcliffiella rhizosphaerae]|uniref:Glutathione peroxidase n=1 Tax=Sutcliffiella rhizosphaerae TaxID=2880967 RepID=A0ABN8AE58_9BACI|nr:glutathione peroxidase [Sutcliffiella rhizosphaerae]CAG9622017.1 Hydroperoxy fatty acid reductase gpx1 [Sutcliffiella rhizosphaerae]